ncbi:MAG: glycosyltransferase family 4 protein [Bacteroidota bacterium]
MNKRVLIIVYYWPPSGGGGVQRWIKFVKYLPQLGWTPIVYTPQDAEYPLVDETLASEVSEEVEVLRQPIWEPRKLYKQLFGNEQKKASGAKRDNLDRLFYIPSKERSWKQNLSIWIRGNLIIPDARVFWVKPSIRFLTDYLKKNPVDAIITSGTPHSLHLIGKALKARLGLPWLADFRDPWTDIEYYDLMMLTRWADAKHRRLEREVLQQADVVTIVSNAWRRKVEQLGARRAHTITNGYDEADFAASLPPLSPHFLLGHIGTLANDRNPEVLWQALKELAEEMPGFRENLRVQVVGNTDPLVVQTARDYGLEQQLINHGYVTHAEAIRLMQSAQVLLLLINKAANNAEGRIPGKIFEYLAARRPILAIGLEEGDSGQIIRETQSGEVVGFGDLERLKEILSHYYQQYQKGVLKVASSAYQRYSRQALTQKLAELLKSMI